MTTATRSVAVVAARLPNTDRRALSQAWFSALHSATPQAGRSPAHSASPQPLVTAQRPATQAAGIPSATDCRAAQLPRQQRTIGGGSFSVERRGPSGALARRIELALARHRTVTPQQAVAIAINAGDGRVQLLVRTDGATTRIIALCAPHLRERVDRALAHARFALATTGARVEAAQ